jgi:hypothetical protein
MEQSLVSPAVPDSQKVDLIALIKDDMSVYDRSGKKVGHVDGMYGGAHGESVPPSTMTTPVPMPASGGQAMPAVTPVAAPAKVPAFGDVLDQDDDFPREMRERLEHDGFVRIDAGFLRHHRFALRDQIDSVAGESVTLNVLADELIKH